MDKFKVEDYEHVLMAYAYVGIQTAANKIEDTLKKWPNYPGLALANATLQELKLRRQVELLTANLGAAMEKGFDPTSESLTMENTAEGLFLVATKHDDSPPGDGEQGR